MAIDFPSSPSVGQVYTFAGVSYVFTSAGIWAAAGGPSTISPGAPQGRLTLATGTPVMTTTQAAKTTIFYTPYVGDRIPLYDGTSMVPVQQVTELSVATNDTVNSPAAIGVNKVNDWFVWRDPGGVLRLVHGPDWTSDTARSAGTALQRIFGILVNSASITNGPPAQRGTYVGTTRSNASSQLDWIPNPASVAGGSPAFLYVWNAYNRVSIIATEADGTNSWSYNGPERDSNASTNNSIHWVDGLGENYTLCEFSQLASAPYSYLSILPMGGLISFAVQTYNGIGTLLATAKCIIAPSVGRRFIQAREDTASSGAITFFGTNAGANRYYLLSANLEM